MTRSDQSFTLDQIHAAAEKVRSGADFPRYVQDLKALGVRSYDNYVADGRTTYFGTEDFAVHSPAKYPPMSLPASGSAEKLKHALSIHQQGQTDYPTFCRQAADAGVEKWTSDLREMTVSYVDAQGNVLVVEMIPVSH
jgi:uncharacterized protein YbcV (DUF1398 family)